MGTLVELHDGTLHRSKVEDMDFHRVKWLDLENPSEKELEMVSDLVKLSLPNLQTFLDRDELSRTAEADHFSVVVCKAPIKQKHHSHISSTSLTFFISERLLITMHKDPINCIQGAIDQPDERLELLLKSGTSELFYYLNEMIIGDFFAGLDEVEDQIDRIEDKVFANPSQHTVKKIFSLKRTLIYFHKALAANRDVLISMQKPDDVIQLTDGVRDRVIHLYYDVVQLLDVVATYRDILTGTLDIYLSAVSNSMNAVMKKMAAYGTIVLVPTFITGLYGMNFRFMPELPWRYGYLFAWGLIIASVVFLWTYFKRRDWF